VPVDPNVDHGVVTKLEPVIDKARKVAVANAAIKFNEDVELYLKEQITTLTEQQKVPVEKMLEHLKNQNDEILRYVKKLLKR